MPGARRERKDRGRWPMVFDNADDKQLFFGGPADGSSSDASGNVGKLGQYIPECPHGSFLITARNRQAGLSLAKGNTPTEVSEMNDIESHKLPHPKLTENPASDELPTLSPRLEHLLLALAQAAAFIEANSIPVSEYLQLLEKSDGDLVDLLSEEFETVGKDTKTPHAVTETWILSFEQIQRQNVSAIVMSCGKNSANPKSDGVADIFPAEDQHQISLTAPVIP
ncbi:hypothetical protein B0H63DRAFT_450325 [Podospora didyma]|uniref:Uncharacterized protein n=1 Tax=Podospora didyma TaxID=330526 RepID=A0AAE0NGA5_9PEZI|nr:hypothetical protein B0H63DRAFT_450325 [Podospora didyma]